MDAPHNAYARWYVSDYMTGLLAELERIHGPSPDLPPLPGDPDYPWGAR